MDFMKEQQEKTNTILTQLDKVVQMCEYDIAERPCGELCRKQVCDLLTNILC